MTNVEKRKAEDTQEIGQLLWDACISLSENGDVLMAKCLGEFVEPIWDEAAQPEYHAEYHADPF